MDAEPIVLILDIDGTIIGNILYQLVVFDLKNSHVRLNYNNKDLYDRFDKGMLRPYFDLFIRSIKKHIPNIEIFIYTASEDRWAQFVVSAIERHTNVKFNRPIFSRKHCIPKQNDYTKSIGKIYPSIKRVLQRKYRKQINLNNRIMVIDNRMVYLSDQSKYILKCPTYDYTIPENLPALISEQTFQAHKILLEQKCRRYLNYMTSFKTYREFEIAFYRHYISELESPKESTDKFWLLLLKLIEVKNIRFFTPRAIEYMNKKLSKKL